MKIGVVKEKEKRVPLVPDAVKKLVKLEGVEVLLEEGLTGLFSREEYLLAGATFTSREECLVNADIMLQVNPLPSDEISKLKEGCLLVSFLDPYNNKELVMKMMNQGVRAISMEMIPRTTIAQKMDALSSQASLAGYVAVMQGANELEKIFPMMMTPAGTISPSKVFVIGAGVAGLQAIATAKRLGARVTAFDTRSVVKEQVESLGGKFLEVDLGETGQTKDGYAKALSSEQLALQQKAMAKTCAASDLVITTAKLFGRPAPKIITEDILRQMKPGSVIVDLAALSGGNVFGTKVDETVQVHGVKIIGLDNLAGEVAYDASSMYASNLINLITHFWDQENKCINYNFDDEILKGCLITYDKKLINQRLIDFYGGM